MTLLDESDKDDFLKRYKEEYYDFYVGGACDEDGEYWADVEHRIFPSIADIIISHH